MPATCLQSAIGTTIVKGFTPARNVTGGHLVAGRPGGGHEGRRRGDDGTSWRWSRHRPDDRLRSRGQAFATATGLTSAAGRLLGPAATAPEAAYGAYTCIKA